MGSYGGRGEPIFLKEDSAARQQLLQLEALQRKTGEAYRELLEQDIRMLKAGIAGEEQILYELRSSHLPMVVLHDLFIRDKELSAQIDFVVVTPKITFFLECKNLFGDIFIGPDGSFTRTIQYQGRTIREGIYSPVTQNERHMELVKTLGSKSMGIFRKKIFLNGFYQTNYPLVVLSNPKSVLDAGQAPKDIQKQVIRADQLVRHIRECNQQSRAISLSASGMERCARNFLSLHSDEPRDYTQKYRQAAAAAPERAPEPPLFRPRREEPSAGQTCPRCGAPLLQKNGKFGPFWGCSRYPQCRYTRQG